MNSMSIPHIPSVLDTFETIELHSLDPSTLDEAIQWLIHADKAVFLQKMDQIPKKTLEKVVKADQKLHKSSAQTAHIYEESARKELLKEDYLKVPDLWDSKKTNTFRDSLIRGGNWAQQYLKTVDEELELEAEWNWSIENIKKQLNILEAFDMLKKGDQGVQKYLEDRRQLYLSNPRNPQLVTDEHFVHLLEICNGTKSPTSFEGIAREISQCGKREIAFREMEIKIHKLSTKDAVKLLQGKWFTPLQKRSRSTRTEIIQLLQELNALDNFVTEQLEKRRYDCGLGDPLWYLLERSEEWGGNFVLQYLHSLFALSAELTSFHRVLTQQLNSLPQPSAAIEDLGPDEENVQVAMKIGVWFQQAELEKLFGFKPYEDFRKFYEIGIRMDNLEKIHNKDEFIKFYQEIDS